MMKRSQARSPGGQETFWPGIADSLLAALMIVVLLSLGGLVLFALKPNTTNDRLRELQDQLDKVRLAKNALENTNAQLRSELERLKLEPPIIELTDAQMVTFKSREAKIAPEFAVHLQRNVFPQLIYIIDQNPSVDTIEIIGHTDDTAIGPPRSNPRSNPHSNLDEKLAAVLSGNLDSGSLEPGSNADLGLMRAAAVREAWGRWLISSGTALVRKIEVRCYSAANAIPPHEIANESVDQRDGRARRIEIRFTKLKAPNSRN